MTPLLRPLLPQAVGSDQLEVTVANLIERLISLSIAGTNVIPWAAPVPSFGDLLSSTVATLGLNPSNREFVDDKGRELDGSMRRFHTLRSLGLGRWSEARVRHVRQIADSCRSYFFGNPYDGWFRALDHIISGTNSSYYTSSAAACHLDLIPYATACKWTELAPRQRSSLLATAGDTLGLLLRDSRIRLIVLNGRTVVDCLEALAGTEFKRAARQDWALARKSGLHVTGIAYTGSLHELAGVSLGRSVAVLGYNHNIQSSFGVTKRVREAIRFWIGRIASEGTS